jgi:hypothetical protein
LYYTFLTTYQDLQDKMGSQISKRVNLSMVQNATQELQVSTKSKPLYIYKDPKTEIEFLTKEQYEMRGISDGLVRPKSWCYYIRKITSIKNCYIKHLSSDILSNNDLFALAPECYAWTEGRVSPLATVWSEPYVLVINPYYKL